MFKWSNNLLRRVTALLMCVCMVMGNISFAVSDTVEVYSEPVMLATAGLTYDPATEAKLSDYAKLSHKLEADRNGTALPDVVENGQSLFFQLAFELTKEDGLYLLRKAYQNGEVGPDTTFTVDVSFLNLLGSANYPTSYEDQDNIASDNGVNIFRWWVDESTGKICLRFYENVYKGEGDVSNTKVAFEGTLDTSGHDDNGQLHFGVDGETVSFTARQDYALTKTAGVPYYSTDASSYLVDYTVTLTLDQNMKLTPGAEGVMYGAALTLEDTVLENGALEGEIYGDPVITAPEGETAAVAVATAGTTNTLTVSSPDQQLQKGEYTFVYKMKVDSAAALTKLNGYTDAQKTNTVEVKENGESLKTPLTATATIAWDKVTENQFKIDKNAFTDHTEEYGGAYLDEANERVYVDFRVTVFIKEPFSTFTVDDWANYALTFRSPDEAPVTLEGVDTSDNFWNNNPSTADLTYVDAIVTNTIEGGKNVITLTAPEGELLPPGAYQLRVPADITEAVRAAQKNNYPQYYSNTAWLVKVDDYVPTEKKEWKSLVPTHDAAQKAGGYEVDTSTGELIFVDGKPLIRWDVYFGWNFYDKTTFTDTLTGMDLLVDDDHPFEIHSFDNKNKHKERLASFTSLTDTSYIDFNEAGNGFTFTTENLDLNSDGSYVKLYKLVYFATPAEDAEGNYLTSGLKNSYVVNHTDPFGNGFAHGPITGESEPTMTANARLYVSKKHVVELNDTTTKWQITVDNKNKVPFQVLSSLAVIDAIPHPQEVGELDVIYSAERPISLNMTLPGIKQPIPLTEGVHYTIVKELEDFNFGTNGNHGFAAVMNMEALEKILAENNVTYFSKIDMTVFLKNTPYPSGGANEKTLKNDGGVLFTNQGQQLLEYVNASYKRGFATKRKDAPAYGDYYDPTTFRNYTVCTVNGNSAQAFTGGYDDNPANGDGNDEILWKIFIGAREFENDKEPITVTVTDTLSENQMFPTYKGKELKDLFLIEANKNKGYIIVPDSVELNGNTFTLTFTVPGGYWAGGKQWTSADIYIYYHTILKPEAIKDAMDAAPEGAETVTLNYDNTATVGWNGDEYTLPTSTGSQAFSTTMLDKTSSIVTAVSEIEYSIIINENRVPLNGGQPLVLTDTLGEGKEGFLYRDDSVRLINMDNAKVLTAGSAVTDSTYTITWATGESKGFTICVPDGQRLKLTYRVKPQASIGTNTDKLTNSASLDGRTDSHVQDSFQVSASNQEATYTPPEGTAAISIRKLEGGNSVQILLEGAVFAAYPVNADGTLGEAVGTWTTNATGRTNMEFKRNGDKGYETVYCIKEIQAPTGYIASSAEWYFYFSTAAGEFANAEVKSIVERLRLSGKTVQQVMNQTVHQMNVENMPVVCDLRIRKVDAAGSDLPGAIFTLQDAKGNRLPAPTMAVEDGVSYYVFSDLKGGNYTLTETKAPDGYQTGEKSSWDITLDSVNQTVTINWAEGTSEKLKSYIAASEPATLTVLNDQVPPAVLELPVIKTLDGVDTADAVFAFTIAAADAQQPMPAQTTITTEGAVYAGGSTAVAFAPIEYTYDMVGNVYTYTITENTVNESTGFLTCTDVYQVQVEVLWNGSEVVAQVKSVLRNDESAEAVEFINTYIPYISIAGTKIWSDTDDQDGLRPDSIKLKLLASGEPVLDADGNEFILTVSGEGDEWAWSIEDLPKFKDGEEIVYTVAEVPVNGYEASYSEDTLTITNTHIPELTSATVKKVWEDTDDQDGKRPETLTVTLSDGTEVELNEGNGWTATVENLPKYENGEQIAYTWTEGEMPEGYTLTGTAVNGTITTLTNSYTPELTSATVKKVWEDADDQDGKRPETLTVTLSDGTEVELNEGNGWTATVENLPKFEEGEQITYTWTEGEMPEGYTLTGTAVNGTITTLTNSYTPELTSATVKKVWDDADDQDGKRPEALTVTLSDGTEVELNEGNGWTATVENLPKYADGAAIEYTWTEGEMPEGYTLTGTAVNGTITTLTNSYTPELTSATVKKVWDDADDQDGKRPETLTVTLSDGTEVELNEGNSWTATVENLPKYADGAAIEYTWTEGEMPEGYSLTGTAVSGTITTLTNSYSPELTSATVKKVWEDADDQDGKRPETLTVTLSDGTEVELNEGNGWTATVENLPKYADGAAIEYTWTEGEMPEGYSLTGTAVNGTITTLTNSYIPELTSATVKKVWEDTDDQDGKRPETLTVTLSDGTEVELNEGNGWTATVENLPKYADGAAIEYTWTEGEMPEGYTLTGTAVNGTVTTLTNSYSPELTSATVKKVWEDADDQDGKRPETLTVTLSDGTEVELNEGNGWTATVENLPKYADGAAIEYTWTEGEMPEGYTLTGTAVNGTVTTLTNSYSPELTSATVKKVWEDADDQDGKRPETLTVTLSDGTEVELNEGNGWTATVENLPKFEDGEQIAYTWTEGEMPEGYTLTGTAVNGTVTTLTNSYSPELTSATVKKVWEDADDQDGKRPETLTVTLSDGTEVELNEGNGWTATVENLPKYADGVAITYTWTEGEMPEGYTLTGTAVNGTITTLTNSYTPELTSATVKKVWEDADDQDGKRPETLTVTLSDGTEVELNEGNGWTATVENLPKFEDGEQIAYTWTEGEMPEGYTLTGTAVNGTITTLTNSYTPELTSATVKKVWEDADDQDGKRPDALTVTLSDGTEVELNEGNGWTATVENLPKYADGAAIEYTWTEGEMPEGYSLTGTAVSGTITTLTNSYTPEVTSISVTKYWDDANDQDGLRPDSITVHLMADNTAADSAEITPDADGNWSYTFTGLPKYKAGEEIEYTIAEASVSGYSTAITGNAASGYVITNTRTPDQTSVSGVKFWEDADDQDGLRPVSFVITLYGNAQPVDSVTVTAENGWKWSFTGLPQRDHGEDIVYTIEESNMLDAEGNPVTAYASEVDGFNVTNSYTPATISIAGEKNWDDANNQDGIRPGSITVYLKADTEIKETVTVTPDENGVWSWSFTDLPKYRDGGVEIVYAVVEEEVDGYTPAVEGHSITNTHTPETVEVSGSKTWDDDNDRDGKRPEMITINLLADGTVVDTAVVTEADGWAWSFTDLPKYEIGNVGHELTYTIEEVLTEADAANYTATVSGYDVTNTHTPETVEVSGSKTWDDDENRDGKRPEKITINLLADGTVVDTAVVTEADGWAWSFTDLPKYEIGNVGHELTYTIEEVLTEADAANYTSTVSGYDVTNTHTPETVEVSGSKTWDDDSNRDGKRPEMITINLLADGTVVDTAVVTEADGWAWSFTDLPKYEIGNVGHELTYTIEEVLTEADAANYTATVSGYDVTNTHTPETVEVSGSKTWDDDSNRDGKRPEKITINLLADGTVVDTAVVTEADGWAWSFTDLPKYEIGNVGHELTYTIEEVLTEADAANYTATVSGYDVTNTHTPETVEVSGSKTWDDDSNRDGKRPEKITINLLADGTVVDTAVVTEADGWAWSFTDLPKYEIGNEGHLVSYSITEEAVPGYIAEITTTGVTADGQRPDEFVYSITNTHVPEEVEISGSKTWNDLNNIASTRPESITINLLADGAVVDTAIVTAADGWAWSFTGLPKYEAGKVGHELTYTITEDAVPGYGTVVNGTDVTNTLYLNAFQKVDEQTGKPLSGAGFALYQGRLLKPEGEPVMTWFSTGTPVLLPGLTPGESYTIFETKTPEGYVTMPPFVFTAQETDTPDGYRTFTAANRHVYRFRKLNSVNNELVYNAYMAVMQGDTVIDSWFSSGENNGWHEVASAALVPGVTYTFTELAAPSGYLKAAPIEFTIDAETGLLIVAGKPTNGAEIVMYDQPAPQATPTPEPTETEFHLTKRWEDREDVLGLRPDTITVYLFRKASGDASYPELPFMTVIVSDNGTDRWNFTFSNLPRRDAQGNLYIYMAKEEPVEGYTTTYLNDGRTIVNTIPEEDLPPTPTPTLPYATPTPGPSAKPPVGVQYINGVWYYVDEYGIPLGVVPQTGDYTDFSMWGVAIVLPMLIAALAAVEIRRRKRLMAAAESCEEE